MSKFNFQNPALASSTPETRRQANLFFNTELSDLTIKIGTRKFPVHKVVLRSASSVFRNMIIDDEKFQTLEIEDISPYLFYTVLRYIYNNTLDITNVNDTFAILRFSVKHKLDLLEEKCYQQLEAREITNENFWDYFNYYDEYPKDMTLKMKFNAFNFFEANYHWVFDSDKFFFLSQNTIFEIVSREMTQIPETELCNSVINWAKMQCHLNGFKPSNENQRTMLGNALYQLRLLSLKPFFVQENSIGNLLTEKEMEAVMKKLSELLPLSWDLNLVSKERNEKFVSSVITEYNSSVHKNGYIVFAKDAFIHSMYFYNTIFKSSFLTNIATRIVISPLCKTKEGKILECPFAMVTKKIGEKNFYYFEIKSLYMQANVMYEIEIEMNDGLGLCYNTQKTNKNCEMLFPGNGKILRNYKKFVSTDYWKNYFDEANLDETFLDSQEKKKSFIYYMEVTFL